MKRAIFFAVACVIVLLWTSARVFSTEFAQVRTYTPAIAWSPPAQVVANGYNTYNYRQSEEWIQNQAEINQLRGALQVYQSLGLTPPSPQKPEALPQPEGAPTEQPQTTSPPAAGKYPLLMAKCANCHGTPTPAGDFFINPSESFDGDENAWKIVKILKKTYNGLMPVDKDGNPHPLSDEEYSQLEHEFLAAPQ